MRSNKLPKLHQAAKDNDVKTLKKLLADQNDPLKDDLRGSSSPVMLAVKNGSVDALKLLMRDSRIKKGGYVDKRGSRNRLITPMIAAARYNQVCVLDFLFKDPASWHEDPTEAFQTAVAFGQVEAARYLYETGKVKVNDFSGFSYPPLIQATILNHKELVRFLLTIPELNRFLRGDQSSCAIQFAVRNSCKDVLEMLCREGCYDLNYLYPNSPIISLACRLNADKIVSYLLCRSEVDPNRSGKSGFTPLEEACRANALDCVRLLLSCSQVNVNRIGCEGPLLVLACQFSDISIIRYLLSHDRVDVNQVTEDSKSALHYAAESGRIDIVKLLLACPRIEINLRSCKGDTPFVYACLRDDPEIVSAFLQHPKVIWDHRNYNKVHILVRISAPFYLQSWRVLMNVPDILNLLRNPTIIAECLNRVLNSSHFPSLKEFLFTLHRFLTRIFFLASFFVINP